MNSAMMIYIFFLVVPLLVMVPTLAMKINGDDVIAETVAPESGRRSRRASGTAESPTDTQKVDAFLKLMNANETTKAIADNPEVDTSNRMNNVVNTYASNAANSESVLKEYIKDKITDDITSGFNVHHIRRYPDDFWQRMGRYVVTVYNNTSGYRFKVHEYKPYLQKDGLAELVGDVDEVGAAVFSKYKTIMFPSTPTKGVFVFINSPKVARKCVLERSLVSNDRSVQLYIFDWEISSFNTYDAENVEKYGAGVHTSVMVLSDGVDRPDV
eukprot:Lankesteria_metandrocarpae@DN5460_c1_g1_i1.p1